MRNCFRVSRRTSAPERLPMLLMKQESKGKNIKLSFIAKPMRMTVIILCAIIMVITGCELIETIDAQIKPPTAKPGTQTTPTPPTIPTGAVTSVIRDHGVISVHFCQTENCADYWINFADKAESQLHCALYELNEPRIKTFLEGKQNEINLKVVLDEDSENDTEIRELVIDKGSALMHNKFCVIDEKHVITGSMNPTVNDVTKNDNNLVLISSDKIAKLYEQEFDELWNKKKNNKTIASPFLFDSTQIAIYFCPEDECADKVIKELQTAEKEIYFMTFSFTNTGITNEILLKHNKSIEVKGVFETRQNSEYSSYHVMNYQDIDVYLDANKNTMHHKVIIVDSLCVITGSMNPTKNGDERNDENLLIICDKDIAAQYLEEFWRVYNAAKEAEENKSN